MILAILSNLLQTFQSTKFNLLNFTPDRSFARVHVDLSDMDLLLPVRMIDLRCSDRSAEVRALTSKQRWM